MDRINILHLSDLHINKTDDFDVSIILDALLSDLRRIKRSYRRPHLVIFSGDLANGGDNLNEYTAALENFVLPVVEECGISEDRFFIVPGNHDARQSVYDETKTVYETIDREIDNREKLNRYSDTEEAGIIVREKFLNFDGLRSLVSGKYLIQENPFASSYYIEEYNISILTFNTAWNSTTALGRSDEGKLLVAEKPIYQAIKSLPPHSKKIFVGHHPLGWIREFARTDLQRLLDEHADLSLFGHMHMSDPRVTHSVKGQTFYNQSGALYSGRDRWNGYAIISLSARTKHVEATLRSYFDGQKAFDAGLNVATGGVFYSSTEAEKFWSAHPERLDEEVFSSWLTSSAVAAARDEFRNCAYDKPLDQVFVEPTLSTRADPNRANLKEYRDSLVTADDIISSCKHYLVCSKREYGKTTLLKYLSLRELEIDKVDGDHRLPLYVNFADIPRGRNKILRALRAALPDDLPDGITLELLLQLGRITLLVDEFNPERKKEFDQFTEFLTAYPKVRYILSVDSRVSDLLTDLSPDLPFEFEKVFILSFSRNKLRKLVANWTNERSDVLDKILDRIVSDIVHINVPITAVTGSIFLTIIERNSDFKPINRAVLVNQFVEVLLGKHAPEEALRDTFDYTNKSHYLAYVAEVMARSDAYVLSKETLREVTKKYMGNYAFDRDPDDVINLFLSARVFTKVDGIIKFAYRAFLEYFVAVRMADDRGFYEYILSNENYLRFVNEIEYYTGLKRHDLDLVHTIAGRLEDLTESIRGNGEWHPDLTLFRKFRVSGTSQEELVANVEKALRLPRLSDEERDDVLEGEMPRDVGQRQDVYRPVFTHDGSRWLVCLMLFSRIIRNSELIIAPEKRRNLLMVLTRWSEMCVHLMAEAPQLAKHRKIVINGVKYIVGFGENLSEQELLLRLYHVIPENIKRSILQNLGSEKLGVTLRDALTDGTSEPVVVTFFRKMLYADLKLSKYPEKLVGLLDDLRGSEFLQHVMLEEIRYMFRVAAPGEQEELRKVLVPLLRQLSKDTPEKKTAKVSHEIERLRRESLLLRYHDERGVE